MNAGIQDPEIVPALIRLRRNPKARLSGAEMQSINAALALAQEDVFGEAPLALKERLSGILQNHRGEWERRWR